MVRTRTARLLAAALAAAGGATLLSGCVLARQVVPTDASGMEFPLDYAAGVVHQQVRTTGTFFAEFPGFIARHTEECWTHLWWER